MYKRYSTVMCGLRSALLSHAYCDVDDVRSTQAVRPRTEAGTIARDNASLTHGIVKVASSPTPFPHRLNTPKKCDHRSQTVLPWHYHALCPPSPINAKTNHAVAANVNQHIHPRPRADAQRHARPAAAAPCTPRCRSTMHAHAQRHARPAAAAPMSVCEAKVPFPSKSVRGCEQKPIAEDCYGCACACTPSTTDVLALCRPLPPGRCRSFIVPWGARFLQTERPLGARSASPHYDTCAAVKA